MKNGLAIELNYYAKQVVGNIVSDMGGEKVMLSVEKGKYYNLGETGGYIWDQLKNKIQINQLITQLMSEYNVEESECKEHVVTFLKLLLDENLIEISSNI